MTVNARPHESSFSFVVARVGVCAAGEQHLYSVLSTVCTVPHESSVTFVVAHFNRSQQPACVSHNNQHVHYSEGALAEVLFIRKEAR